MSAPSHRTSRLAAYRAIDIIASVAAPALGAAFVGIDARAAAPMRLLPENVSSFVVVSCW
jgi:hypothetical protein